MLVKLAYQLDNLSSQLQENIYSYKIIGIEEKKEKDRRPIFYTDRKNVYVYQTMLLPTVGTRRK